MILLPHFDIPYGFRLGKIPYKFPFQGPVFFGLPHPDKLSTPMLEVTDIRTICVRAQFTHIKDPSISSNNIF